MLGRNKLGTTRLGSSGVPAVRYSKSISAGVALSAEVPRTTAKPIAGTVTLSGAVGRACHRALAAGVALSVSLPSHPFIKALSSALALTVSVGRTMARAILAGLGVHGTANRTTQKGTSSGVELSASIPSRPFIKALAAGVRLSATAGRTIKKGISASIAASATVGRKIGRGLAAGIALSATVGRTVRRPLSAGVALSATVTRGAKKALASGVALSAGLARTTKKQLASTLVTSVSVGRFLWRSVSTGFALSVSVGRTTAKRLATATVVLSASLVKSVHELLEGGIELSATVGRVIKKQIQAGIRLAAEVPRNVYDMAWEMNKPIRKILGRVAITYSDPFFAAGVNATASETGDYTYPSQTADNVTTEAYKWFSLHRNGLSGDYHPLPAHREYSVGWWNATLGDAVTGIFAVPPVLTIEHTARSVESLLVVGDDKLDEYPVDFWVRLYSDGDVLEYEFHETANAAVTWTKALTPSESGIVKHELEIVQWSRPGSVAKIAQFFTMLEETYDSEDGGLFSIRVLEEREYSEATIPQGNISANEIYVRLNNIDDLFSAGNPYSPLRDVLLNNRAIRAWSGCDLRSGERIWFPLGTFYSRNWSTPEGEPWAEVTGLDMLDRLKQSTFSTSEVYENETLYNLAVTVMADAGLTDADWEIDPVLDTAAYTIPYAWFDQMSHREALKRIAAAALGQVYCNRVGKVVVEVYIPPARMPASDFHFTESNFFEIDHPLRWSEMINYVEAQATPRIPGSEDDICIDLEEFTVPGLGATTKTHFFDTTPCIEVVDPLVFTNPGGHVSLDSMTIYAWGVLATYSNSDAADETVTDVTIRGKRLEIQGGRIVVAQDSASIASNGKQALSVPITSAFWQSEAQAQAAVASLLAAYKDPRRDVEMRSRGNIALKLGDRVVASDFRSLVDAEYALLRQDISYDGGMEVQVTAQRIATEEGVVHHKTIQAGIEVQASAGRVVT